MPIFIFFIIICFIPLAAWSEENFQWKNIREGVFHVASPTQQPLFVSWKPTWISEANTDYLYWLNANGQLLNQRAIRPDKPSGMAVFSIEHSRGEHQLIIPGYSFRQFSFTQPSTTRMLFEPSKVHFSLTATPGLTLYFKVAAQTPAVLAGKYHAGSKRLTAKRLKDGHAIKLELNNYEEYWDFDQIKLPLSSQSEIWSLTFQDAGRVAFWLDETDNLFASKVQDFEPLSWQQGSVNLTVTNTVVGPSPKLGLAMPYIYPAPEELTLLKQLQPQAAGYYSFVDALVRMPNREQKTKKLYTNELSIKHGLTLLAGSGRVAVLEDNSITQQGLNYWLSDLTLLNKDITPYLSFADEPNLNYRSYHDFEAYFEKMLKLVKQHPAANRIRITVPASSRWIDGPFLDDSAQRLGIDWAEALLDKFGPEIDAVAWHEWMNRSLYSTHRYQDSVQAAVDLVGETNGKPNKTLILDQTNISSGHSLSPYEQNTFFAGLWWSSVIINAAKSGKLSILNWFQAIDEGNHTKGMIQSSPPAFKPVGVAHQFIRQYWLKDVVELTSDAFEVDAIAVTEDHRINLIGVNKSRRNYNATVNLPNACFASSTLQLLAEDKSTAHANFSCDDKTLRFELPAETLFILNLDK